MLWVGASLFAGWLLNLFGFDNLMINGMRELFDVTMTKTGYYFIFGVVGLMRYILARNSTIDFNNSEKKK